MVYKYWGRYTTTSALTAAKEKPKPTLTPASLLCLYWLSDARNTYSIAQYQTRLKLDIGITETIIVRALRSLG